MRITEAMTDRVVAWAEALHVPLDRGQAYALLEAALGPVTHREREQARHIKHIERARSYEQERAREEREQSAARIRQLEQALAELGKQRRIQRVLRALAQKVTGG